MHIRDIFAAHKTTFSFEFFPPKTDAAADQLFEHLRQLESLKPVFVSVTYGAGGTTRERTHNLVMRIKGTTTLDPVPHLTCVGHTEAEVHDILERYAAGGVSNILALAGDLPKDMTDRSHDAFQHAAHLVAFIKKFNDEGKHPDARGFGIGVAGFPEGHPATPNRLQEMEHLKAKVDAGADYICTQLFFDNNDFYDFCERCELAGIRVPIIAGLMPVTSRNGLKRTAELALGARVPARLLRAVLRAENDEAVEKVGVHWATQQAFDLFDRKVAGIHFYTLNRSKPTLKIYESLAVGEAGNRGSVER